jgi:hypothetical protein
VNQRKFIIGKVNVEVNTTNADSAMTFKNEFIRLLKERLFPAFEEKLAEHDEPGSVIRFPILSLDVTVPEGSSLQVLETEINNRFSMAIEKGLTDTSESFNPSNEQVFYSSGVSSARGTREENVASREKRAVAEHIPIERNREEIFLHFLEKGYLPWYGSEKEVGELSRSPRWEKSLDKINFSTRLVDLLRRGDTPLQRLIYQLDESSLIAFLQRVNPAIKKRGDSLHGLLSRFPRDTRNAITRFLAVVSIQREVAPIEREARRLAAKLRLTKTGNEPENAHVTMLRANLLEIISAPEPGSGTDRNRVAAILTASLQEGGLIPDSKETDRIKEPAPPVLAEREGMDANAGASVNETQGSFFIDGEGAIAVQNAGLILLHPFLKTLFSELRLIDQKGAIKNDARQVAIQVLHFLATSNREFFEGNLVFEKFLCGAALNEPIERESLLTESIMAECTAMLQQVIHHWPALKNSSPGWLQQLFLQRRGKLVKKEGRAKLRVERMPQDTLLDALDWNISLVQIPWHKELLFVEW